MPFCCTECASYGYHSQRCGNNQPKHLRTLLRIRNFADFMAHAKRDYNSAKCSPERNYNISPRVEEILNSQTPEIKHAISDTGVLGSVRDINKVLMARCKIATHTVEDWHRLGGKGTQTPTTLNQQATGSLTPGTKTDSQPSTLITPPTLAAQQPP
eukprot:16439174-Heterocapsa_arctica.AAC.1